jgi:hypothetical protein
VGVADLAPGCSRLSSRLTLTGPSTASRFVEATSHRAFGGAAHRAGPLLTPQGRLRRRSAIAARPLTREPLRPLRARFAGRPRACPFWRAAPPKAGLTTMIMASARKRPKTARKRAETPIMRPGRAAHAPIRGSRTSSGPTLPVDRLCGPTRGARAESGSATTRRCPTPASWPPGGPERADLEPGGLDAGGLDAARVRCLLWPKPWRWRTRGLPRSR